MATKSAVYNNRVIAQAENGSIEVYYKNTAACLREIAEELGFEYDEKWNTRQLGSKLIAHIQQNKPKATPKANSTKENGVLKKAIWQQCGENFEFEAVSDTCLQVKSNGNILSKDDMVDALDQVFDKCSALISEKFGFDSDPWTNFEDTDLTNIPKELLQNLLPLINEQNEEADRRWKWWSNLDDSCRYVLLRSINIGAELDPFGANGPEIISIHFGYNKNKQSSIIHVINEIVEEVEFIEWHPDADFTFGGLAFLPNLEELRIADCSVIHLYADDIGSLTQLKKLSFYKSEIEIQGFNDEDDINAFAALTNLEELNIRRTDLGEEDVEKIKELLPNCNVMSDYD